MKSKLNKLRNLRKLFNAVGNTKGFTLTELLIVIAILGFIGTFAISNIMESYDRAKIDGTKVQIRNLGTVLDQYRLDCGSYPTTEQGLEALISAPTIGRACKNYASKGYIKGDKVPKDGFGHDFSYISDGDTYEIISLGNDEKEGGEGANGDISSNKLD